MTISFLRFGFGMAEIKRKDYITVLNFIATLGVVVLHCNGCYWEGPSQGQSWFTASLIETLFYWPVPIFFMIPGVTLLDYRARMRTEEYLKKRVSKTVIPFVFWSLFALAWVSLAPWIMNKPELSPLAIVDGIINTRFVSIYWFFPPLFALYASIPVLSLIDNRRKVFIYLAVLSMAFVCVIPFGCRVFGITWNKEFTPPIVGGYILYLVLGWLLDHETLSTRFLRIVYCLGCIGFLIHLVGTHYLSVRAGYVDKFFKGYLNLPALMQASAVFLWAKNWDWEKGFAAKLAGLSKRLQPYTFGVFLIHWYLIDAATNWFGINRRLFVWRTAGALAVFATCIGITWMMQRIPVLRKVVPR